MVGFRAAQGDVDASHGGDHGVLPVERQGGAEQRGDTQYCADQPDAPHCTTDAVSGMGYVVHVCMCIFLV